MPVGAGSIRRVAKAAGTEKATENAKEVTPIVKKVVEKTATSTKKTAAKVSNTKANKPATKAVETMATNTAEYNKVCHITEELPIYLL